VPRVSAVGDDRVIAGIADGGDPRHRHR